MFYCDFPQRQFLVSTQTALFSSCSLSERKCVYLSISGDTSVCRVIFSGKGISSQMAPEEAVTNIKNLVISTTERGSQDHNSLLAAYKVLDQHITKMGIKRPVVLLTDGHSSRFNFEVLQFCREKQIQMFVSPPDTTGVTQLLDQFNQKLHLEYKNSKESLFTAWSTINRGASRGF